MASRVSRAKQFLPFDALVGFREALKEKETEYEDKKELTEDSYEELENTLNRLEIGKKAKIKYYKNKTSRNLLYWWAGMDSNHRTQMRTDLQSAAFSHSATYP